MFYFSWQEIVLDYYPGMSPGNDKLEREAGGPETEEKVWQEKQRGREIWKCPTAVFDHKSGIPVASKS